jgi:nitrate reductase gamma subunit
MKQNERNFWLDSSLFIIFLSTIFTGFILWILIPHQTAAVILGLNRDFWRSVHICSGLAIAVGNVIHLIWHRDWLKALRKQRRRW